MSNPASQTRAQDEQALHWLRLRCDGYQAEQIAAHYGVSSARVRTVTQRIRNADEAESGEDVSSAYWPVRGRR